MSNHKHHNGYKGQKKSKSGKDRRPDSGYAEDPMEVDSPIIENGSSAQFNGQYGMGMVNGFHHLNGDAAKDVAKGNGMVITAGVGVRSPACRRRNRPISAGAVSITQVVTKDEPPDTESTTLLRPATAEGARIRPNFSYQPDTARNDDDDDDVVGDVTIGAVSLEDTKPEKPDIKPEKLDIKHQKPHPKPQKPESPWNPHTSCGRPKQPVKPEPPKRETITVYVRNCANGNKPYRFQVRETDLVETLMKEVYDRLGFPIDQQRMTYAGKNLKENRTLQDYHIKNNSTVDLVVRLRGG